MTIQPLLNRLLKKVKIRNKKRTIILFLLALNLIIPGIIVSSNIYKLNGSRGTFYTKRIAERSEFVPHEYTANKIASLEKAVAEKEEAERKRAELEQNAQRAEAVLARYNSPMRGYGEIIVRRADECGGDFRVLMGIAGNESGFGRIPYKLYNPYGYLDGRQYSGWTEALEFLSCVISQRFLAPCNNDLVCIINKYGGSDTNKEKWISNVQFFINII